MHSPPAETLPRGGAESLPERQRRGSAAPAGGELAVLLTEARERTLALVERVGAHDMDRVHDPLMSPLAWDLGHIAAFEDLWVCRAAGGLEPLRPELMEVYDATETPRTRRGELPYLRSDEARELMAEVRRRALEVLDAADLADDGDPLNAGGFVWEMLVQHEHQHNETMLQTLALAEPGVYEPRRRPLPPAPATPPGDGTVRVEAGPFLVGAGPPARSAAGDPRSQAEAGGFAYDNERPQHELELPAFEIDRTPVTNGAHLEFVEQGGYRRREWWSDEGWAWKEAGGIERPLGWTADGRARSFERTEPLDPRLPIMRVSWYEADAFARSQGKRLPTEAEWEKAASWDAEAGVKRRYPWGDDPPSAERANLDQTGFGPAPVGAYPAGASAYGVLGLVGDAWEWTASRFAGYPGFRAFPYAEYSQIFFGGDHRVLRGGSWATRPRAIRATFRNWDFPQRRQIFAGFRCARDG